MSRPGEEECTLNPALPLLVWIAAKAACSLVLTGSFVGVSPNPDPFCTKKAFLPPHTLLELSESSRGDGP